MANRLIDIRPGRRQFLQAAVPASVVIVAAPSLAIARGNGNGGGRLGTIPTLYPGWNARNFAEIRDTETTHTEAIIELLGSEARPKPTFRNLAARNADQFVRMSRAFENTGVGAYQGGAPYIFDKGLLAIAAATALVEGYFAGYLNTLLDSPIVPNRSPFSFALTQEEVRRRVAPYLVSLNGGPPLAFQLARSPQNDIAIFNFALFLEYLEREFYQLNYNRIFGRSSG